MFRKSKIIFELGNSSIKLVETSCEKSKGKLIVHNYAVIPLIASGLKAIPAHDPAVMAELINKELKKPGWKSKEAYGVLSGEGIISRDLLIDKVPDKVLDDKIKADCFQYLPIDLNNYVVDYKILSEVQTEEGPKYKVYIVAVPQKTIDTYLEIVQRCKLNLEVIDINGNTLSKLLTLEMKKNNLSLQENDAVIGLEIGAKGSYIVFVQNGIFQFAREISFGGMDLINILSEYKSFDILQAENELKSNAEKYFKIEENPAYSDEEDSYIGKDIMKRANDFVDEVSKIISFYKTRYSCKNILKIYLTGGTSNLKRLNEFIKSNTHIECEKLSELKCLQNETKRDINDSIGVLSNVFGASIRD